MYRFRAGSDGRKKWRGTGVKSTWYKADVTGVLAPAAILGAVRLFVLLNTNCVGCRLAAQLLPGVDISSGSDELAWLVDLNCTEILL